MKIKEMKSIDLFCASPASTAICSSTVGQRRRHSTKPHHNRTFFNTTTSTARCLSQLPIDPSKPFLNHRKSTSDSAYNNNNKRRSDDDRKLLLRRKSSADVDDLCGSRHLLSDHEPHYLDFVVDSKRADLQISRQPMKQEKGRNNNYKRLDSSDGLVKSFKSSSITSKTYDTPVYEASLMSSSDGVNVQKPDSDSNNHKVVELRVSIHCKGCEGKLRKHISRMEGVTSFSIDLATKKVRVIGNVRPLEVLTSISKVKNAQFWPSPTSSSLIKVN